MSAKRKGDAHQLPTKRGRKKKTDEDFESDASEDDIAEIEDNVAEKDVEVLIMDDEKPNKLPEELLATYDKEPGQLMIAGQVTWELVGRKDKKNKTSKIRPNLWSFNRFTEEKVMRFILSSLCCIK